MNKKVVMLVTICLSVWHAGAQVSNKLDSLLHRASLMANDSARIKILRDIGYNYTRESTQQAKYYFAEAIAIGERIHEYTYTGSTYTQMVLLYANLGNFDSAAYFLKRSKEKAAVLNTPKAWSGYYQGEGLYYKKKGDFKKAISSFRLQLVASLKTDTASTDIAGTYINIGNCYMSQGVFREAVQYFLKALDIFDPMGNQAGIAYCHNNIGNIYNLLEEYDKALPHLQKALSIKQSLKDNRGLVVTYLGLSQTYYGQRQLAKAMDYVKRCLDLNQSVQSNPDMINGYIQMARIYKRQKDTVNARLAYDNAKQFATAAKNETQLTKISLEAAGLDTVYRSPLQHKSLTSMRDGLHSAMANRDSAAILDYYQQLATWNAEKGDYKSAFQYAMQHETLEPKIYGPAVIDKVKDLENNFEIRKREQQILLLQKNRELTESRLQEQNLWLISTFVFALLVTLIAGLLVNRYRIVQKTRRLQEMEKMRSNIARDLHDDIGSTLSSIQIMSTLALKNTTSGKSPESTLAKITELSGKISEGMREIVWAINPCNDNLGKTILHMREYAGQMLEIDDIILNFKEKIATPERSLTPQMRRNLLMIYKEAINNARKYSNCTQIDVRVTQKDNKLQLQIADYGIGFDMNNTKNGNGLRNMQERAENMQASINISSCINKGTEIKLAIVLP